MEALDVVGWILLTLAATLVGFGQHQIWKVRSSPDFWAQGKKWWEVWLFSFDGDCLNPKGEGHLDRGFVFIIAGVVIGFLALLVFARDHWTMGLT